MLQHARAEYPNECCGLLAGQLSVVRGQLPVGQVTKRYPLVNELRSPTEYQSEPRSILRAEKDMRQGELELLAIYHSHPTSEPVPSRKDLERNFYGDTVVHFIISLRENQPRVRGWRLGETMFSEADWEQVE
jgi:proteasome lid subunit RPN8/RPN11